MKKERNKVTKYHKQREKERKGKQSKAKQDRSKQDRRGTGSITKKGKGREVKTKKRREGGKLKELK